MAIHYRDSRSQDRSGKALRPWLVALAVAAVLLWFNPDLVAKLPRAIVDFLRLPRS
jgi:hypothetical protein